MFCSRTIKVKINCKVLFLVSDYQSLSTRVKVLVCVAVVKAIVSHLNELLCGKVM